MQNKAIAVIITPSNSSQNSTILLRERQGFLELLNCDMNAPSNNPNHITQVIKDETDWWPNIEYNNIFSFNGDRDSIYWCLEFNGKNLLDENTKLLKPEKRFIRCNSDNGLRWFGINNFINNVWDKSIFKDNHFDVARAGILYWLENFQEKLQVSK